MNIYAFDECSILHLCKLKIRSAFRPFFNEAFIAHKNSQKLSFLLKNIQTKNQVKARFVPNENFESNLIKSYNDMLEKQGNVGILGLTFKKIC